MSKKQDDYYFDNFMKCAEYSCKAAYLLKETLYLIFDYPYKYYTFKHFEV